MNLPVYNETGKMTDEEKEIFTKATGRRFQRARKIRKRTTQEAAAAVGVPAYYLYKIEEGMVLPPVLIHLRLAKYYSFSLLDLLHTGDTCLDDETWTGETGQSKIISYTELYGAFGQVERSEEFKNGRTQHKRNIKTARR